MFINPDGGVIWTIASTKLEDNIRRDLRLVLQQQKKVKMLNVSLILLAAGESKRMGTPKQLLSYKGRSLIRHAATEAIGLNCDRVIVCLKQH